MYINRKIFKCRGNLRNSDVGKEPCNTSRNILTEAAEFPCQNCQFKRTLCPAGTNFSSGKILSRRPRIIRGLYLSKKLLEYQKSSTLFRFSFQKPDEEIYTNGEPKLLIKKLIFPMSMTTAGFAICKQDQ